MLSSSGWVSLSLYQYCHNHITRAGEGAHLRLCYILCGPGARMRRADIYLIPPVCILSKLGQTWREGQQTIILCGHNVDCDASASGELL